MALLYMQTHTEMTDNKIKYTQLVKVQSITQRLLYTFAVSYITRT